MLMLGKNKIDFSQLEFSQSHILHFTCMLCVHKHEWENSQQLELRRAGQDSEKGNNNFVFSVRK